MFQDKLEFLDIIKVAPKIPLQNGTFTMFALGTNLPFLCFLVFYEIVLQQTLLHEAFKIPTQWDHYTNWSTEDWSEPFSLTTSLSKILSPKLIKLLFLYLVPYHVLEFLSVTAVVDSASRLLGGEETERSTNLRNMIEKFVKETKLKGPFVTSVYVRLLSTSLLVGLIWIVADYLILSRGHGFVYDYTNYGYYYYHRRSVGNVVKWLVCLVYYLDSKKRVLDVELGTRPKGTNTEE